MQEKKLPNLRVLSETMAGNVQRTIKLIDQLAETTDLILAAAEKGDWNKVRQTSEMLAQAGRVCGLPEIAVHAKELCEAIDKPYNTLDMKKSLIRLISRCGRVRGPQTPATS